MTSSPTTQAMTLYDVAADAAERYGDRDFLVIGRRAEVLSFRALAEGADQFARLLAGHGAMPGDRIALWMTNHAQWAIAAYGISRCGCVMVGLSTRLTAREVAHMLELSQAGILVMEDNFLDKFDAVEIVSKALDLLEERNGARPRIILYARTGKALAGATDWSDGIAKARNLPSLPPAAELASAAGDYGYPELRGVAAILSTSGTTGAPKGVMLTHDGLIRLARGVAHRQWLTPDERFYSVAPFFHCSGYMHGLLTNLVAGSTYFSTTAYNVQEAWDVITGERVTVYHGFVGMLKDFADGRSFDFSHLNRFDRAWYSAPANQMASLEQTLHVKMCEVYGLTETGGNTAICTADDPTDMRHDSDGRPHEGLEVRIVDPATGAELPESAPGEICIRGWNVMRGYFRDPDATAKAIDRDGWLHTGDQGVRLPGGYIKFISRLKDIIRVGGENLSPLEVEEVLITHPAVNEAAVVAEPHPRLMEVPVAFLRLKGGHSATGEELERFCRERLANFKVPRRFIVLDDFPRTGATSRIQKARLREMLMETAND